jgi:hypothetical protein
MKKKQQRPTVIFGVGIDPMELIHEIIYASKKAGFDWYSWSFDKIADEMEEEIKMRERYHKRRSIEKATTRGKKHGKKKSKS